MSAAACHCCDISLAGFTLAHTRCTYCRQNCIYANGLHAHTPRPHERSGGGATTVSVTGGRGPSTPPPAPHALSGADRSPGPGGMGTAETPGPATTNYRGWPEDA